jgi:hypothetical protein
LSDIIETSSGVHIILRIGWENDSKSWLS